MRVIANTIVRLLASQLDFTDGKPSARYNHRLLMMLDEFPGLGKLAIMQESVAFIAGYGIKCYLICQDINQLQAHHGGEEAITSNCHIQIAFPPNRLETAEHLAKLIGQNHRCERASQNERQFVLVDSAMYRRRCTRSNVRSSCRTNVTKMFSVLNLVEIQIRNDQNA